MNKEEKEALERIQQELIKEESIPEELQTEPDYLESIKALLGEEEPESLEQTRMFHIPDEPVEEVKNYANGFGDYQDSGDVADPAPRGDKRMTVLTVTAILLTLGILGVLLRWVLLFLH